MGAFTRESVVRRMMINAGLVTKDGSETSPMVRGGLTRITLEVTAFNVAVAILLWIWYASGNKAGILLPLLWSLGASTLVVISLRRALAEPVKPTAASNTAAEL